ncbi:uncharacterized mitochondrial protein AtMg00820-like [Solanum stenotomum]|uniref:uncharacterized mitochondrial protein AtMg00820-like n=1 Tax=Solanum stenotomum TaxID=172797 RepID=UPI0020D0D520|nr:uncharacterized mitochondrial protein AtMg00820-like [Solanum stenotomum]
MYTDPSYVSPLFPTFEDLSSSFKRFKPGFVYERRRPILSYPDTDPPPETVPQLESENSSRSGPLKPTRRSTRKAMKEELLALKENDTWDIVSCPSNVRPIGCKWVYSIKFHSDGSLNRYKARLVVLGNRQEYGVNYEETFAPVAKMTTM